MNKVAVVSNSSVLKHMYETKLIEIEKQLATAVQTQVVETSRALELLTLSFKDIVAINNNFQAIDNKCFECKSLLSHFSTIKKMSLARNNLNSSKAIHRLFHQIPQRAKHLLQLLETDPDRHLLSVYLKVRKLVKLRDETLNKGLKYIMDDNQNQQNMKKHFLLIDKVVLCLEKQIRQNIADALFLAIEEPHVLVETLKICEYEDKNAHKMKRVLTYSAQDWSQWKVTEDFSAANDTDNGNENGNANTAVAVVDEEKESPPRKISNESMKSKVESEILDSIAALITALNERFNECKNENKSMRHFLDGIDENIKDLDVVNEHLRMCFPPYYQIVNFYVSHYQTLLTPLIIDRLEIENVPTQERLFVVSWIAKFKANIIKLEAEMKRINNEDTEEGGTASSAAEISHRNKQKQKRNLKMIEHLSGQENILLLSYINTCKKKLHSWITNIVNTESREENYFMIDNIPRTHCVQDLFTALNIQFNIAIQQLCGLPFLQVIEMILKAMDLFESLLSAHITNSYQSFNDEYFCAMLNSCYDVSQKLKVRSDTILDSPETYSLNVKSQTKLDDMFDGRICHFTNLGKNCATKLAFKIYDDSLHENLFEVLFTEEDIMDENNSIVENIIVTVADYLKDFRVWIEEQYFYSECVKQLIVLLIDKYLVRLLKLKPRSIKVQTKIENDCRLLNDYFSDADVQKHCDISKLWMEKYKLLKSIYGALSADEGFLDIYMEPLQKMQSPHQKQIIDYIQRQRNFRKKYRNNSDAQPMDFGNTNASGFQPNSNIKQDFKSAGKKMLHILKLDEQND